MEYPFLSEFIHQNANRYGEEDALKVQNKHTKKWNSISWNTFSENVKKTAYSLCEWGIKENSNIGVYTQNMAECFYIDFAAFANRAITVPMYATATVSQISYIVNESDIEILFVGEQMQYDTAWEVFCEKKSLKQLIIIDKDVIKNTADQSSLYFEDFISTHIQETTINLVEERRKAVKADDTVHLIYTSGTTGEPKGVILKQSNYLEAMRIHEIQLALPDRFTSMCMLPLTHIFEKAWSILCLQKGCTLAINRDPREIQTTLKEIRPNAMCCVPRFWEKVYAGVQNKIESSSPLLKKVFLDAIKTGEKHNLNFKCKGRKAPLWTRIKFGFYNKTVYKLLKKNIGIDRGVIFPCAGAALSDTINTLIQSVNIPLIYGYGLTETTATVSCFIKNNFEIGTVGTVMPGVEVKIGADNEILVKGKTVMHGYYKKPAETMNAMTEDGWLKTGDAGFLSEKNEIVMTERIKDLYKTSNGKYIAPQQIETQLGEDKYINTIAVIGDQRRYVTALIVPEPEELKKFAQANNLEYDNDAELCKKEQVIKLFKERIEKRQHSFASYEQIKKFTIIPHLFTIETGELTNTLKLRRAVISEKYKKEIEAMY